jgi:hypothetical protein
VIPSSRGPRVPAVRGDTQRHPVPRIGVSRTWRCRRERARCATRQRSARGESGAGAARRGASCTSGSGAGTHVANSTRAWAGCLGQMGVPGSGTPVPRGSADPERAQPLAAPHAYCTRPLAVVSCGVPYKSGLRPRSRRGLPAAAVTVGAAPTLHPRNRRPREAVGGLDARHEARAGCGRQPCTTMPDIDRTAN